MSKLHMLICMLLLGGGFIFGALRNPFFLDAASFRAEGVEGLRLAGVAVCNRDRVALIDDGERRFIVRRDMYVHTFQVQRIGDDFVVISTPEGVRTLRLM